VVEDDRDLLEFTGELLIRLGYQVFAASSAENALQFLEKGVCPDLILSDIQLSGTINGIELAKRAIERRPNTKIILTSGYDEYFQNHILKNDFPFIGKPYRLTELNDAVNSALDVA
jgi:DNA-binding NtrC family response regulator